MSSMFSSAWEVQRTANCLVSITTGHHHHSLRPSLCSPLHFSQCAIFTWFDGTHPTFPQSCFLYSQCEKGVETDHSITGESVGSLPRERLNCTNQGLPPASAARKWPVEVQTIIMLVSRFVNLWLVDKYHYGDIAVCSSNFLWFIANLRASKTVRADECNQYWHCAISRVQVWGTCRDN